MRTVVGATLAGLVLCCASATLAQTAAGTIRAGETLRGTLEPKEIHHPSGWIMDVYEFQAEEGQRLTLILRSNTFDAFLDLDQGDTHLVNDDDSGGGPDGTDARIVFDPPATGTYRIQVTSVDHKTTGAYALSLERGGELVSIAQTVTPRGARRPPPLQEIRYGQNIGARLTALSPLHDDDTPYLPFTFRGKRGEIVTIDMKSDDFDAYLVLRQSGSDRDLATDDDGGEETSARLIYALPADGTYEIRANAVTPDAQGAFTLSLAAPRQGARPGEAADITYGQTVRGALEIGDHMGEDNSLYDAYRFRGQARQRVVISMRSTDFDAYLALLDSTGKEVASNDDAGPEGTDAEISVTLPADGEYLIMANSLTEGERGGYILGLSLQGR